MVRNMATSLILYEKIQTTVPKAKLIVPIVERLIASSKKDSKLNIHRRLNSFLMDKNAVKKLINELLERYKERPSGFLRSVKMGYRPGDAARKVQVELV